MCLQGLLLNQQLVSKLQTEIYPVHYDKPVAAQKCNLAKNNTARVRPQKLDVYLFIGKKYNCIATAHFSSSNDENYPGQ